jgi:site-specific recombinase XerD
MPTVDFAARVETTIESIQSNDDIHPDNKEAIKSFKRDLALADMSDAWLQKLTAHLKVIAEHVSDTRFEDMDEDDLKDLVEWVQSRDVSDATVNAYKQVIKRFWRWLFDLPKGQHPEMTAWINTTGPKDNDTLPSDLLTVEEVNNLIDGCRNDRDRAFIALLWETGARIGELIDLTVSDLDDNTHGMKVVIEGKTGARRLPLVDSVPYLNRWLNRHPNPNDDAPLWCKLQDAYDTLSYHYIRQKLLVRAKERAGIDKPVNPHHFRHSRATYLANKYTEAQLCEWFGWVQGSDVPAKYVHLSGRDIDNAYYELHGLETPDEDDEDDTVTKCPRCEELNESDAAFCMRCGFALDQDAESIEDQIEDDIKQSYAQTDPDDTEQQEDIAELETAMDDIDLKQKLHTKIDQLDDDRLMQLLQE